MSTLDPRKMLDELARIWRALPPHPVKPENRGVCRLFPSGHVARGQVFRLAAQPEITGHNHPLIIMHRDDVTSMRAELACTPWGRFKPLDTIDQEIADLCEEVFAQRDLDRTRRTRLD